MFKLLAQWFVNALAIYLVSMLVDGFYIKNYQTALAASLVLGIVNFLVKPIIIILTLPITIITLGLFTWVINAFMLYLSAAFLTGVEISSFGTAFIAVILLAIVNTLFNMIIKR